MAGFGVKNIGESENVVPQSFLHRILERYIAQINRIESLRFVT